AYQKGHPPMEEFCVLGRVYLDSCGNCMLLLDNTAPADLFRKDCPDVLTRHELEWVLRGSYFVASSVRLADERARCAICGDGWTLRTCHDVVQSAAHDDAPTHEACYRRDLVKRHRQEMLVLFAKAGFDPTRTNLISIPNEYWPKGARGEPPYYATPWYSVQVDDGAV